MPAALHIRRLDYGSAEYRSAVRLRARLLREPLGLTLRPEETADDMHRLHWGAFAGECLLGCVSLAPENSHTGILRQLAVDAARRRGGIGRALVECLEHAARQRGLRRITMHARAEAQGFYEKLGYQPQGEIFEEFTLAHIYMEKTL